MIGTIDPTKSDVKIIGAGISGMLAAYYLHRKGYHVTLIEKESFSGGMIRTLQTPLGPVETAAHSFLGSSDITELCHELGVALTSVRKDSRARYVLRDRSLRRFPLSVKETLGVVYRLSTKRAHPQEILESMTVADWAKTFLGQAALDFLVTPMLMGIHGCLPEELQLQAAYPQWTPLPGKTLLQSLKMKAKEKKREKRAPLLAPLHGMGYFMRLLEQAVEGQLKERFQKNHEIQSLSELEKDGKNSNIILSVPAYAASHLLKESDPLLAEALQQIPYTPLVIATCFVPLSDLIRPPRGVGVLIPPQEKMNSLGILFNSSAFDQRVRDPSWVSLSFFLGGTLRPNVLELSDLEIQKEIEDDMNILLGYKTSSRPLRLHLSRWAQAIPLYSSQLLKARQQALKGWCAKRGHVLFSNYSGELSVRQLVTEAKTFLS